jgi:hypothetical protein
MKHVLECTVLLGLTLCLSDNADAQVRQSGNVTPTHVACWTSTGIVQDCGASSNPYPTTFGVLNGTGADGICVQSAAPTSAGYQRACLGTTTAGGALLSVQKFGTAPTGGFQFQVNGSIQALPTITLPVTNGGFACFVGTSGTMADCSTSPTNISGPGSATVGHVVSWNNTAGTQLADSGVFPMVGPGSTTNGNLVTWSGSGGLTLADSGIASSSVAFLSTNNVWTGTNTFQSASGVPVTIIGPSSLSRNLDIGQTFAGTDTSATHQLNNIAIVDTANLGTHVGNGLNINHIINGGTFGARQALQVGVTLNSASNASNTRHFYAAAQFGAAANSGDNGTNTGAGALGSIIALNPAVTTNNGAVNLAEASGMQITMFTLSGSSVSQRSGIEISDNSGAGGIQGATFDDAIVMGNVVGSAGWKCGLCFDATNFGSAPLATSATAIKTVGAQTINTFIDASSATLTTFLKSTGFSVDGAGNIVGNTAQFGTVAPSGNNIIEISAAGATGRFFSVHNNGAADQALFGLDTAGVMVLECVTCAATQFGTQNTVALNFQTNSVNRLVIAGDRTHGSWSGTAPVLSACGGGTPTIVGNDMHGTVTMGTSASGCVITFAGSFGSQPNCTVTWRATPLASQSYAVTTAAITLTQTSTSSNVVDYQCRGI